MSDDYQFVRSQNLLFSLLLALLIQYQPHYWRMSLSYSSPSMAVHVLKYRFFGGIQVIKLRISHPFPDWFPSWKCRVKCRFFSLYKTPSEGALYGWPFPGSCHLQDHVHTSQHSRESSQCFVSCLIISSTANVPSPLMPQ